MNTSNNSEHRSNAENKRIVVLDTETTGMNTEGGPHYLGHRIIEIGAVEIVNRKLTGRHFHVYIKPDRAIQEEAIGVHGITDEFTMQDSRSKRGGRIEVGSDGDKSWTLTPGGDSYTAGQETLFVHERVGYKFADEGGAEKFQGVTLRQELEKMGFQDQEREHLGRHERSAVAGDLLEYEAKSSGLGLDFQQALETFKLSPRMGI